MVAELPLSLITRIEFCLFNDSESLNNSLNHYHKLKKEACIQKLLQLGPPLLKPSYLLSFKRDSKSRASQILYGNLLDVYQQSNFHAHLDFNYKRVTRKYKCLH
jgi:hypothetical protein